MRVSKDKERKLVKVSAYIPKMHHEELQIASKAQGLPVSRLVALSIDRDLDRPDAFTYNFTLPSEDEFLEYAYAHEAGLLLNFLKTQEVGMGLDQLILCRRDIGIKDENVLLAAFNECLNKDLIEGYKPVMKNYFAGGFNEDYLYYVVKGNRPTKRRSKSKRNKASKYSLYQKLKKEFGDE